MIDDISLSTQRATLQFLENAYILENSKAVDTVIGRIFFYWECVNFLKTQCQTPKYISNIQLGLDHYKSIYYDRIPTELSLVILTKPNLDIHSELIAISIYNSFGRTFSIYVDAIKTMTKVSAKEKRKVIILETLVRAREEIILSCQSATSFQKIIDSLNRIEELIKTKENFNDVNLIGGE